MKKNLFLLSITLLCISCSSDTDKAQKLIKDTIAEKKIEGYKPIEFGTLDSVYTKYGDLPEFIESFHKMEEATENLRKQNTELKIKMIPFELGIATKSDIEELDKVKNKVDEAMSEMDKYRNELDSIEANFVPQFNGYSMTHKLNADEFGQSVQEFTFFFDEGLSQITDLEEKN